MVEAAVAMVEEAAALEAAAAISVAAVAILVAAALGISLVAAVSAGLPGIALRATVLSATASQNTEECALRTTEIISGMEIISATGEISFLETPFFMFTDTCTSICTMAIMTTMPATI